MWRHLTRNSRSLQAIRRKHSYSVSYTGRKQYGKLESSCELGHSPIRRALDSDRFDRTPCSKVSYPSDTQGLRQPWALLLLPSTAAILLRVTICLADTTCSWTTQIGASYASVVIAGQ